MFKTLFLIRGIPGSGKSTLAKSLCNDLSINNHFEADSFFERLGHFDANKLKSAHAECQNSAFKAMQNGENLVVSNTFIKKWEMQFYIDKAKQFNYKIFIIIANGNFQSVHNVPPATIERMKQNFEF